MLPIRNAIPTVISIVLLSAIASTGRFLPQVHAAGERAPTSSGASADGVFGSSFDFLYASETDNTVITTIGGALLARLYLPSNPNGAAIALVHGCTGLWQSNQPGTIAQGAIEKWGVKLASDGFVVLATDSYTSRTPGGVPLADFQTQCAGSPYEHAVDPYTTRVTDLAESVNWLRYHFGSAATRVGAIGWSQGAEVVLIQAAATSRDADVLLEQNSPSNRIPLDASVTFYPGCGTLLGFVAGSGVTSSFWRPHADARINHAALDPLVGDCATRASVAVQTYGATTASGHEVEFMSYPNATHSFDTKLADWPTDTCAAGQHSDVCAARDADIASRAFLLQRLVR